MSDDDRLARVALSYLFEPGDPRVTGLTPELGAEKLLSVVLAGSDVDALAADATARAAVLEPDLALERAAALGIRFVVPGDREWPVGLGDLQAAEPVGPHGGVPVGLWLRGPARLDQLGTTVAVVGARAATTYGTDVSASLGFGLAEAGACTVSGAAFGIDQAAHRGALSARGRSVAVLACGVDRVYPSAHERLISHLAAEHLVISETAPGGAPTRTRFLGRNRIIAALCSGTVVVEAALRSGSLNTANWAGRLHRHVMGVPGPITSSQSEGVHQMLREAGGLVVTSAAEVLEVVSPAGEHLTTRARGPEQRRDRLSARQKQVLDAVPVRRAADDESISRAAGVGIVEVRGALRQLLERGLVERHGAGWRLAEDGAGEDGLPFLDWTG